MKIINIKLTDESIRSAINQLTDYKNSLSKRTDELVNVVAKYGANVAKSYVQETSYYEFREIFDNINVISEGQGRAIILSSAPHSMFFEFGTGAVGKASSHPDSEMLKALNWNYDVNEHGESGWWYPTDESDGNPYKWIDSKGQLKAWTKGMPSRPYMFEAAQAIHAVIPSYAKEVFRF